MGETIDTSFYIYSIIKDLDGIYLLTFVLRGEGRCHPPVVTAPLHSGTRDCKRCDARVVQDASDLHVACARVEALRVGLEFGAKMFINSMMEQYAIANSGGDRVKPA